MRRAEQCFKYPKQRGLSKELILTNLVEQPTHNAYRVRREDLNLSDDSPSDGEDGGHNDELRAKLNAQIARTLGLDDSYMVTTASDHPVRKPQLAQPKTAINDGSSDLESDDGAGDDAMQMDDAGEEEFAFRLFSSAAPAQKIILEEDLGPKGEGGFVHPARPLPYYMVTSLSEQQKQEYAFASVSGDQVLARSHGRHWGLELPWKVTTISVTRKCRPGEVTGSKEAGDEKKRRPGKKQRISLRKRAEERAEAQKEEAVKLLEKEEHVKDKKKRLNRLKKLRRREQAKEAKAAKRGEGAAGEVETGNNSEGSD